MGYFLIILIGRVLLNLLHCILTLFKRLFSRKEKLRRLNREKAREKERGSSSKSRSNSEDRNDEIRREKKKRKKEEEREKMKNRDTKGQNAYALGKKSSFNISMDTKMPKTSVSLFFSYSMVT